MKKKLFTLLTLMLCVCSGAWAATEASGNQGTSNQAIIGASYSLDGIYVAGSGGVKQGNMPDKGVKLRSNQGNLVFAVNEGFKITSFKFWGCGNTATAVTIVSATVDGGSNLLSADVVLPGKGGSASGDISLSDINATNNITLTFASGSNAQIVGTWTIEYEQTAVIVQEITGITVNGSAISETDLATLKSSKTLTINGSDFNGLGAVNVTLSSGATTVTRTVSNGNATYTFTINSTEKYTITVTGAAKTYGAAQGSVVAYDNQSTEPNGNTVTANGITLTYPTKTFQYGAGKVTLGSTSYQPLKLSTGEAFTVTLPEGKVATKLIVYGWSINGNGALPTIKEASDSQEKVITNAGSNIFYATNTESDLYPSVYEYELDNWESFYMSAGGSASQPFIVLDFVLEDAAITNTANFKFTAKTDWTNLTQTVSPIKATFGEGCSVQATYVKFTKNNTLTIEALGNYVITNIEMGYDEGYTPKQGTFTANNGEVTADGTSWAGCATTVVINSGNSETRMSTLKVTYCKAETITPAYAKTTYVTTQALDFSNVDGLKAYIATGATAAGVTTEEVGAVPAGTPLLLKGTAGTEYTVPVVAEAEAPETNLLRAGDGTTPFNGETFDYLLAADGKFYQIGSGTIAVGKAYLHLESDPAGARSLNVIFGDEVTGIEAIASGTKADNAVYNLGGQRVAQPTKGLYIVNGKKMIIK